ncbi:MAG TPA: energy transducer TonB [Usitatibacter sp.]
MTIEKRAFARIAAGIAAAIVLSLVALAYEFTRYLPASELDAKPYPMRRIDLDFPASKDGIEYYGKVRLNVFIDSHGGVDRVEVLESRVPQRLRDIAVNAFSQARWEPGRKWGLRVKSVKEVEIDVEPPAGALGQPLRPPDP